MLESLESKLREKIIAMKSYFIDELRLLKNETTINKKQDCNINTEEITTLKNKTKLLELENKLLKDDVTNKQKFIDTILEHNSKLNQNFVVSRISPVTHQARKQQPPERQHYKKRDTEMVNQRKQEENKSREKSNEKMQVTSKKTDHQKKIVYQQTKRTKVFT